LGAWGLELERLVLCVVRERKRKVTVMVRGLERAMGMGLGRGLWRGW
jgi:hypothetical protein